MSVLQSSALPLLAAFVLAAVCAESSDWPQWRGPHNNGSAVSGSYPESWDTENYLWTAPLPGKGCSTPVIWKQSLYLTSAADGHDAVLALDWSGKPLWQTKLGLEVPGQHQNGSGSNPSPTTDGDGLFVNFKSGQLAALELDGSVRWQTNLVDRFGPEVLFWDHGTSPVLTKDDVIMARLHAGDSWVAAFDKKTGEIRWKVPRNYETPNEVDHGYATPVVIDYEGREAVLVWGAQHLTVYDANDGSILMTCGNFNPNGEGFWPAVASPVVVGDIAVLCFGRADRGKPRLFGIRLGGNGDVTDTNHVWFRNDIGTFVPTPAEHGGNVFILNDRGVVECLDAASGTTVWRAELPRASTNYYSSPVVADGKLYAAREDGVVFVASIVDGFKLLSENQFDDRVIASIVPLADRLHIRGEKNLYCVAR